MAFIGWPHERYSNWCAIGIMPVQEDTSDLWEKMYYGPEVNFTRKEYYDEIPRYSDLVLGIIVQKSSNIIIKTDGLGLNGKSFTGTRSPHRTLLSMQAWALLTKPTCRWVYLISEQVIIFLSFRSIFSQKKIGMGWLDPGGVRKRAP